MSIKVSLITTVLNEAQNITEFIKSIASQTKLPNETIIVDGGSTDDTVELLNQLAKKYKKLHLKVIVKPGAYRSVGRNTAISAAKHDIIAITDAGCRLHNDWLEKITEPFENDPVYITGGAYELKTTTLWQRAPAYSASANFAHLDPKTFLPSSRSFALRKQAWQDVGGYPEELFNAEDLIFTEKLRQAQFLQVAVPEAVVDWYPPSTTSGVIKQFWGYSVGDGLAGTQSPHAMGYFLKTTVAGFLMAAYLSYLLPAHIFFGLILIWFGSKSLVRGLRDHKLESDDFGSRLAYIISHFAWAIILFFTTLAGFWWGWYHGLFRAWELERNQK